MAIDRFLAIQFIQENTSTLIKHSISYKKAVFPFLYTPEYIIDMGYVTIDLKTCYSITIINYGPWNVEVAIKKLAKKQFEYSGILIQFEKTMLIVGKTTSLTVTWQPSSAKYVERSTKEQHSIYLEVSRGSTIPIIIKGIITYPFVTVNTKLLDFQNVIVGECLMMKILMKNEGFVDCCWEAKILTTRKKQEDCPFQLNYKSNFLSSGYSEIINVYFKPHKACRVEANLKIIVKMGLETQTVTLLGRGVERKLRISDLNINFPPTILFTEVQEKIFTIENTCDYPVEFFWHHLDSLFLEEERLAEALTRYYGVEEILLPPRKLGERMPSFLMEFYNSLMSEMGYALSTEAIEEKSITASNDDDKLSEHKTTIRGKKKSSSTSKLSVQRSSTQQKSKIDLQKESTIDKSQRKKSTSYSSTSIDNIKKDCPPMSVFSELDVPREPPILPTNDPEELQNLLLCYIETLRKDPSFYERLKDPVKDLFDSLETKTIPELEIIDPSQPAKKICIIFHGAPFTEYQETACRSATILQVPLLCIDKIIIEGIALGDNWASIKLRQIIDEAYQEYLLALEKHKNLLETGLSAIKKVGIEVADHVQKIIAKEESPKQIKLSKAIKLEAEATKIDKHTENNDRELIILFETEFAKIPREEDLNFLDPVSLYECKIQTILLLQKILSHYAATVGSKVGGKDQNNTFLGIEIGLFLEILRERLSSSDFKSGFILQTLNNIFFESDVVTLIVLLNVVGHVEYILFVTFLNSMDNYIRKMEELRELKAQRLAETTAKKIQEIDEMSLSEYELLAEDEKKFYLESTLSRKKQEALQRRMQFVQRITELGKRKKIKDGKTNSQEEKSQTSKAPVNEKEIRDLKEPESTDNSKLRKQETSKDLENIANAMNDYYSSLSAIENIIKHWDPLKKDALFTAKSKISKTDKPKDKSIYTNEYTKEYIHIWYVNATDPWDRVMYDVIVNQMSENSLAKKALPLEIAPKLDLESKKYYILKPRNIRKRDIKNSGAYQIVSLSTISDSVIMTSNSSHISLINKQGSYTENSMHKKRVVDKTEEPSSTSLNTSIIENKQDASITNAIFEIMLKSRWILQPNESQRFKIRYQPEEIGIHQQTYALSIIDGNEVTYDINIHGIADVPRLDMNPNTIFSKVQETKVNNIIDPTYFSDTDTYDFGSLLVFRKDKSAHRREAELKFCNISKVDAKVSFFLQENNPDIFIIEQEELYIQAGQCELLKISAGVTKVDSFTDKLYICIVNNPHVDTIELRCNGSKLDIELDSKQLSFSHVLLYRRNFLACFIRNKSPVEIFWHLDPDGPLDPQISFTPIKGVVKPQSDQKIEFCYHASKIGAIEASLTFNAFFCENDVEPIFVETLTLSGETYDIAIDINHANPIDLKCVKVGFPTSANFTITNRGHYEVKYVVVLEEQNKLAKIASNLPLKLKEDIEISPTIGSIQPKKEITVQITFLSKNEITLKECPILRCRFLDMNKETAVIAEFPLKVSLVAYYTRFRIYPYPEITFASLGICTKKTMYLNIENTGEFLLRYSIEIAPIKHPSNIYMTEIKEDPIKTNLDKTTDMPTKKDKLRIDKKTPQSTAMLKIGPFIITKTEGNIQPGEIDTITIECYPECVGLQEEQIMILVPDSTPEDRSGKLIKLSVNSCIPSVDLQDLDAMFHENHIVDRIEDFICPKEIGAHTIFVRQEKCLYFRYVSVSHTHTAYFVLYNRNVIPADVELILLAESFIPKTVKPDVFVLTPERERIPAMSHKRFAISFNPTFMETCYAVFEIAVELPPHLKDDKFFMKLVGQACVPQITIVEPPSGKREQIVLNFGRTLINDSNEKKFTFENIGVIPAKVIVEIYENSNFLFTLNTCDSARNYLLSNWDCGADMSNDRCVVVRLMPGERTSFKIKFIPQEIGKYEGQVRLFITDNPYENLIIDLKGEVYAESIVLEGLELTNIKFDSTNEKRESSNKSRRSQNSIVGVLTPSTLPVSLSYKLDYGYCFVNKIYKKSFKIVNKSVNRYSRFQWNTHPNVVFTPSIGHLQPMTYKEIVATFLSSEPVNYVDTCVDCTICVIELANTSKESSWDDRETEVQWVTMNLDSEQEINSEILAKKVVEPVNEPSHEIVPGTTKCIQVLLNAIVAFSKYSCPVKEINFKDSLMFQTREYVFTFSNTGTVDVEYVWQINMNEQYPMRLTNSRSTPRSKGNTRSRANSSICGIHERRRRHNPSYTMTEMTKNTKLNHQQVVLSRENIIEVKPTACHCGPSDLFSSSAGLTERSSDSWLESDNLPFGIHPEKGTLPPGESMEYILRFFPMDVFDYKAHLTCKIENLDPELSELIIPIAGRSLLPYCHFDVPESDYLSGDRRNTKLPGPIDYQSIDGSLPEDTRVIELNVVGIGDTHIKKFRMINPTSDDYHFAWKDRTRRVESEVPNFHCVFPEGIAERGKQVDFVFTFLAEDIGTFESFWLFSIEKYNLECLFLFVAIVREPSVYCSLVHLKMKPTVLGVNIRESISVINNEEFQLSFQIVRDSLYSEGRVQSLKLMPMNGILNPKDEQVFWIEYKPTVVGEFQFCIKCIVKKLKIPLTIFVTTMTYDIIVSVTYVDQNGQVVRLNKNEENIIDCGKMMLKAPFTITFEITNSSKMALYYSWDLGMTPEIISRNMYTIGIQQKQGHIVSESQSNCCLTIEALQKTMIKNHPILLKISRGPTYRLVLKAIANKSILEFNFNHYDFGPCYIRDITAPAHHVDLRITNLDDVPHILECKFEEKPHISANLDVLSEAIIPRSSIIIPIKFRPLEQIHYRDNLNFIIKSTSEKKVIITGEGITYKIRLVNPRDKLVDLGNLSINQTVIRKVPVINDGRAALELKFDLMKNLPGYDRFREQIQVCPRNTNEENSKIDQTLASITETKRSDTFDVTLQTIEPDLSKVLEIEPAESIALQSGKIVNITVKYKSMRRMRPFVAKVAFQTNSTIQPLFILRGSCIGAEFRLNRTCISFGIIVQGCLSETKVVLLNIGDIGARFKWNTSKLPRDFSINPVTGYCSPGMNVNFIVSFRPTRHDSLIEGDATLEIEKYGVLSVKITGGCCKLPDPIDTLFFSCRVREKLMRSLNVENDTATPWKLKPEVFGDYFFVDEVLDVPSKNFATCTITYAPLVMNSENNPHKGTLVLKLPNDKAPLVYSLQGMSLAPQVLQRIIRQFPAKTKYTELLPVYNWLNKWQRFECKIEDSNKVFNKDVKVYTLVGNSKIDVPPNNQRDYRVEFHSYKEMECNFKLTFINEEGEYQFYELQYNVKKPEEIESIKLITSVRSPVCHALRLDNPLKEQHITYMAKCQHPYIMIYDVPKLVTPLSSETIGIEYHPLHPSEESAINLEINCKELGLFPYELRLRATPAPAEKTTRVVAVLGASATFSLTISNHAKKNATFIIKVNNECFTTPKDIDVPALKRASFDVVYEPYDIDNVSATLTATSEIAGEFTFPLIGTYSLPNPQGPYTVTPKAPVQIPFKNIFRETKSFELVLDNPETFVTTTSLEEIKQKQIINIIIRLKDISNKKRELENDSYPITGKLLVYCTDPKISQINWTYYLKGVYD
ncbi:hydrocephalus-inducing protein homolog [Anoplolepis gracilipes]|uniref:hydrocephalus-inducing protein homolog n=1 Tax=Anoplolepis gracilipes TaxID=354296 RepID=UPI003BA26033